MGNFLILCMHACLVTHSCPTLCDPMDCSPPGSPVHGDSPGKNPGVGLPCPSPGDLSNPGIEPRSPTFEADSLPSEPSGKPCLVCSFLSLNCEDRPLKIARKRFVEPSFTGIRNSDDEPKSLVRCPMYCIELQA